MRTLAVGSHGQDVIDAQCALTAAGFYSGDIDGDFGPLMRVAVTAFQNSKGLSPTGEVEPGTAAALGLSDPPVCVCRVPGISADQIQPALFAGTPLANIQCNLGYVLNALEDFQLGDRDMVLVALATLRAEAATFLPVSERAGPANTTPGGQPFDKYVGILGNRGLQDASKYRGRGFIQLTGRANYAQCSLQLFNDDRLLDNPLLLHQPAFAAAALAKFLKDREHKLRAALAARDLAAVRAIINGGSMGVATFVSTYNTGSELQCVLQLPTAVAQRLREDLA